MKKQNIILAASLTAAAAAGAAYSVWENNRLVTEYYTLHKGLSSPIRIVSLADLHGKQFGKNNSHLLGEVLALSPDLIVMPGDTVSFNCINLYETARTIKRLREIAPVVLIPGNHERRSGRMLEIMTRFGDAGATVLCDEMCELNLHGVPVHILGLAEPIAAKRTDYLRAAVGRLAYPNHDAELEKLSQKDGLRIVLTHFPETFAGIGVHSYQRFDFDLLFAGHAHGGQVRLPHIGALYAPGQGFFPKFSAGEYGDRPRMILSRGLGNDSPLPRICDAPEISYVVVN